MEAKETSENQSPGPRAPETISPSAYALLKMKAHTSIPYVREAAELVDAVQITDLAAGIDIDPTDYWLRVMHFESRYNSIDQLLQDLPATNILEISSGFSFRGLDLSNKKDVFYIDTDLPNIVATKQRFIDAFKTPNAQGPSALAASPGSAGPSGQAPGHYELQPLNALDPTAFDAIIAKFPPGPITILNEGLLVYLDDQQKSQLCANIHRALQTRGGAWITADIYIKRKEGEDSRSDAWCAWSREHALEEKKFESFEEAGTFFQKRGFQKEKEATQDYSRLTSFPQFLKATGPKGINQLRSPGRKRLQSTWLLAPTIIPPSNSSPD